MKPRATIVLRVRLPRLDAARTVTAKSNARVATAHADVVTDDGARISGVEGRGGAGPERVGGSRPPSGSEGRGVPGGGRGAALLRGLRPMSSRLARRSPAYAQRKERITRPKGWADQQRTCASTPCATATRATVPGGGRRARGSAKGAILGQAKWMNAWRTRRSPAQLDLYCDSPSNLKPRQSHILGLGAAASATSWRLGTRPPRGQTEGRSPSP